VAVERAQKAIDKLAGERTRFIAWVRSVPEDKWSSMAPDGMWQAHDYVSHLASIDPLLTGLVRIFQTTGAPPAAGRAFSIDDWNEKQILSLRDRSIESLIADMEKSRVDLNAAIAAFTDEQLDKTFHFGGDKSRSPRDVQVGQFLSGLVYHDRWHMEDARRCIEKEAGQHFGDAAWESMLKGTVQTA
jgi:hypothetical protein